MPRPHRIFDASVGTGRPIKVETLAGEAGTSETTVFEWRRDDSTREPSYSHLQALFGSTLIGTEFKLCLINDLLRYAQDVKATACGGSAAEDAAPLSIALNAGADLNELQQMLDEAGCHRSPGGASISTCERNEMETVRARFELLMARLWTSIERRTLRKQATA